MKTKLGLGLIALLLLFAQATANAQDYQVRAWGLNTSGQLGDGTITNRSASVQISGFASVTQISGGNTHTLAL